MSIADGTLLRVGERNFAAALSRILALGREDSTGMRIAETHTLDPVERAVLEYVINFDILRGKRSQLDSEVEMPGVEDWRMVWRLGSLWGASFHGHGHEASGRQSQP